MKVINRLILTLGLLAAVTTSMSAGDAIAIKVPFNFTAGDRMLPAGTYSFSQLLAYPETLKIQNRDSEVSPILIQVRISDSISTPRLVFDRADKDTSSEKSRLMDLGLRRRPQVPKNDGRTGLKMTVR